MEANIQLTADEIKILESVYGRQTFDGISYNPRELESVKELTAQENKFFTGKNFKSSHFFVQTIYKVLGIINPLKFTVTVNRILNENENLRANFCNLGTRTVKVIHPEDVVRPEILFRNLTNIAREDLDTEFINICEADARSLIHLERDPLIRFAVYKTGAEEFAVLVTMAQVISKSFDAQEFFSYLFDHYENIKPKKISDDEDLPPKNYDAIRAYWAKILDNAPPMSALPYEQETNGDYKQKVFRAKIPDDILSDLLNCAQSNRLMLMAILQTAWGFMLQLTNKRRDCIFCQISSADDFSLNMIPVRLIGNDDLTVDEIVRNQFRQLIISQPYSLSNWTALDELTVQKKLFNHFINFKQFTQSEIKHVHYKDAPGDPLGKLIFQGSWNVQDMKLGLYFVYMNKNLILSFAYDEKNFLIGGVEKLYRLYLLILKQLISDWNLPFVDFMSRINDRVGIQLETEVIPPENDHKRIRNFLSQLSILQGHFAGTIGLFEDTAKLITYYEGDRISGDMLNQNFIFVADGLLSRNIDTGDGWYNALDIIEKNSFVNPTSLLDKQMYKVSAAVLTDQAELLLIPRDVFTEVLKKNSEIALSIMKYALEQMQRWQTIWLQA